MAVNFRRIAKWTSAISVLLLLAFMVLLPSAYEKMEPMLDPEQQNVARLESGGSSSVDFQEGHVYVALRLSEGGDPSADLRLMDEQGEEFSGDPPSRLHGERLVNGISREPEARSLIGEVHICRRDTEPLDILCCWQRWPCRKYPQFQRAGQCLGF